MGGQCRKGHLSALRMIMRYLGLSNCVLHAKPPFNSEVLCSTLLVNAPLLSETAIREAECRPKALALALFLPACSAAPPLSSSAPAMPLAVIVIHSAERGGTLPQNRTAKSRGVPRPNETPHAAERRCANREGQLPVLTGPCCSRACARKSKSKR